jgi:hypothetical protein
VTQVPVQRKAGMTFAAALRSLLRQDPDVLMVGATRLPCRCSSVAPRRNGRAKQNGQLPQSRVVRETELGHQVLLVEGDGAEAHTEGPRNVGFGLPLAK